MAKKIRALESSLFSQMRADFSVTGYGKKSGILYTVYASFHKEGKDEEEVLVLRATKGMPIFSKFGTISFCTSEQLTEKESKLTYLTKPDLKEGFWRDIKDYISEKRLTVIKENQEIMQEFMNMFTRRQQIKWESKE